MKDYLKIRKETLFINTWSSTCGNCDKGADLESKTHDKVLGYGAPNNAKGCGVTWKYVGSQYPESVITNEGLKKLRPDLIIDRTVC